MQFNNAKKLISLLDVFKPSKATTTSASNDEVAQHLQNLLANIDRAILSGASFDRILDLLFRDTQHIIQSHYVAFTDLTRHHNNTITTQVIATGGTKKEYSVTAEKTIKLLFRDNPNGLMVTNSEKYAFFKKLISEKSPQIYACPILIEGDIAAVMFFGMAKDAKLSTRDMTNVQMIANRLGVAKTAILRTKQLQVKEYFDPLTGLYNRQACQDRLSQEMSRARRQNTKLAVFYVNIDGFKKINDEFGYAIGDQLLQMVAKKLKAALRDIDVLARVSADEFVVIVSDIEKASHANRVADKIMQLFVAPMTIEQHECYVSTSMGISIYPEDGMNVEEMIQNADSARAMAKKNGASQYAFYEENMSARDVLDSSIERELRHGLAQNQLYMVYQPQYNDRNRQMVGVEALVRWQHPDRGLINPADFVKIAEQSGLIVQLGQYTRKMVFNQFATWKNQGLVLPKVALNLSSYEIQRIEFIPELKQLLADTGLTSDLIEFEITENLFVETKGNVIDNLNALHAMGVTIAIDDFGTGYSNLSYLVRLPFDVLKIDRSFINEIGKYAGSTQIISMMIDIGHLLGKYVCAEGIETEEQLQFLVDSGCDLIQGYLLSKPVSSDALQALILQESSQENGQFIFDAPAISENQVTA